MTDDEFMRHLHRQMEEQKRDQGLTTIRSIERRQKERQKQQKQQQQPKNPQKSR